jgi:hypothetical protein
MGRILGKITARLLKQHGENSPGWHPPRVEKRASAESRRGATGYPMGKGAGRKKDK